MLEYLYPLHGVVFAHFEVIAREVGDRQAVAADHGDVDSYGADAGAEDRRLRRLLCEQQRRGPHEKGNGSGACTGGGAVGAPRG